MKGATTLEGSNSLHLNFATTMKAIEEYLNGRLAVGAKVRVTDLKPLVSDHLIVVKLESRASAKGVDGGEQ